MKDRLEELSARARRHELSESEAQELEQLLTASAEARLWHRAGCEFDAEDAALPADPAAAERVLERLLAESPRKRPASRTSRAVWLVAAAVLVAAVAGAAVVRGRWLAKQTAAPPVSVGVPRPRPGTQPTVNAPFFPPSSLGPPPAPPSATPRNDSAAAEPSALSASPVVPGSPAELFSAAGQARRQGYSSRAISLLDSLQARFPNSPEARSGDITLGMLQLKSGAAASALQHFERYLRRSPHGALSAEALWGRAQALAALGRSPEARQALATLLEQFPSSSFASAARAKLRSEAAAP